MHLAGNTDCRRSVKNTFTCAAALGNYLACTTHLSRSSQWVALAQCETLMSDVVPDLKNEVGLSKTVVGGDFSLGEERNAQECVPGGWTMKDGKYSQNVGFDSALRFESSEKVAPQTDTRHDGLLVRMSAV
jgi:hypothetical protein